MVPLDICTPDKLSRSPKYLKIELLP